MHHFLCSVDFFAVFYFRNVYKPSFSELRPVLALATRGWSDSLERSAQSVSKWPIFEGPCDWDVRGLMPPLSLQGQRLQSGEHVIWCLCHLQSWIGTNERRRKVCRVHDPQNPVEGAEIQTKIKSLDRHDWLSEGSAKDLFRRKTSGAGFDGSTHLSRVHPDVGVKDMVLIGMQPTLVKTVI